MKTLFSSVFFLIGFIFSSSTQAQLTMRSMLNVRLDIEEVEKYELKKTEEPGFETVFLDVDYGGFELRDSKEAAVLEDAVVKSVDLVYTKYPADQDLTELNKKRIAYLHVVCPSIFGNPLTNWRVVAQTKCTSEATAKRYFHGFVITYRPAPSVESTRREKEEFRRSFFDHSRISDSSVLKIFKRNKWKNMTVVSDFTGSMSPYISQIMLWYSLTFATKDFKEFIFFNDGDAKSSAEKRMGSTGGIYYCKSTNKDTVLNTALRCQTGGGGGDAQENNMEAALYAIEKNPKLKEIIMIVDNWAPMRDFALIEKVKIPVHVIVCGVAKDTPINPQYLHLAIKTKGSIHTVEDDLYKLSELAEGKTIKIYGLTYRMSKGRLVPIKSS